MPTLFARGSDGTVCIYTGASDVVDAPLGDLSRVLFHSALLYPAVVSTLTATITLPAVAANDDAGRTHTVGAHGKAGTPFVLGYISNLSNLPLAGSVPLDKDARGFGRWVTLGADATNVIIHEQTVCGFDNGFSSRAIVVVALVTDLLL